MRIKWMSKPLVRNVYVKKSNIQGYGVFADKELFPGDVIEQCYCLYINERPARLHNYYFNPRFEDQNVDWGCFALGYGSIYNHSDVPNAEFDFDHTNSVIFFTANRFIRRDEEIFINYGKQWFEDREINKIQTSVIYSPIPVKYRIKKIYRDNTSFIKTCLRGAAVILSIKLASVLAAAVVVGN